MGVERFLTWRPAPSGSYFALATAQGCAGQLTKVPAIDARKTTQVIEPAIQRNLRYLLAARAGFFQLTVHSYKATDKNIFSRRHVQLAPKRSLEFAQACCGMGTNAADTNWPGIVRFDIFARVL